MRNKTLVNTVRSRFCHSLVSTFISPVHQVKQLMQCTVKSAETSSGKNTQGNMYTLECLLLLTDSSTITGFLAQIKKTGWELKAVFLTDLLKHVLEWCFPNSPKPQLYGDKIPPQTTVLPVYPQSPRTWFTLVLAFWGVWRCWNCVWFWLCSLVLCEGFCMPSLLGWLMCSCYTAQNNFFPICSLQICFLLRALQILALMALDFIWRPALPITLDIFVQLFHLLPDFTGHKPATIQLWQLF